MKNKIEMSNKKYQLLTGGFLIAGIGIGFLFGSKSATNVSYIIGGILAAIGIILLISTRFTK